MNSVFDLFYPKKSKTIRARLKDREVKTDKNELYKTRIHVYSIINNLDEPPNGKIITYRRKQRNFYNTEFQIKHIIIVLTESKKTNNKTTL